MKLHLKRTAKRLLTVLSLLLLVLAGVVAILVRTGLDERWARGAIVRQIEHMTGGRVQLERFRFSILGLKAELLSFTIYGREPEGTPPFFHADRLFVDVRVDSLVRRKISLDEVTLDRPAVHIRFDEQGRTNVPSPGPRREPAEKPFRERIFDVAIREFRLNDGYVLYNDLRVPLVAQGGAFDFALDYEVPSDAEAFYSGRFSWEQFLLAARRYLPFPTDIEGQFTLGRNRFELEQFRWRLPHSAFSVTATVENPAQPQWQVRYDGELNLEDLREIMRKPNSPSGIVDLSGRIDNSSGRLGLRGRYHARDITLRYEWFHAGGIETTGQYFLENGGIVVPDFEARALGGVIHGRVEFTFKEQRFRVISKGRGMSVAQVLAAVDNETMPVATLGWKGSMDVDSETTWLRDFKSVESTGISIWSPPVVPPDSGLPVTARLEYHYLMDASAVEMRQSEISTPESIITFDGRLGRRDTALLVEFHTENLEPWNDFIYALRDPNAKRVALRGTAHWRGRVTGRLDHPTFLGHIRATRAAYGGILWDEIEGEISYSPDGFRITQARARRGDAAADLVLWLELDSWDFRPEHQWSGEANLVRAPTDGLQQLFGTAFPVHGLVTGQFRLRGTRGDPELTGLVDVADVTAWDLHFERVRGQLALRKDEVRVANAELRIGSGRITGDLLYRFLKDEVEFDIDGAVVPIERIRPVQTERLPLGGQLSFQLKGRGPLVAPQAEGSVRVVDLTVGEDVLGSLQGNLLADGRHVRLTLQSALPTGNITGTLAMSLDRDFPLEGDLTVEGVDLDAFIETAFHLRELTGDSRVDGRFRIAGQMARPETLTIEASISRLEFDYQYLRLRNEGPLRFGYRREEVRIEQAHIRGPDTNFTISGFVRFTGDRTISLQLDGTVNLRLASGFAPELDARGVAQINGSVEGTFASPRITGRVAVRDVSATYGELPVGLNNMNGDFIFDRSRLVFEEVRAESGGGMLDLSGTVTYSERPVRFDISARAEPVRIRYPEGMSWLAGGTLRLSGTTHGGLLSGRVEVERLFMSEGLDLASLLTASPATPQAPPTASEFLRNLQFDIEASSTPDARVEWSGARFDSEASLRVRGTWEHPILLGHVRLLSGEMTLRGNRYRVLRGDLNFSNPFRLNPDIDVEAQTTVRQFEITLNITGKADKLSLSYRSDPPLPPGDILTLLALGRTGEESELRRATAETSPELGAGALLSEAISSQVTGRLERLFGITRFRVDPFLAGTGTEQNATARITIEQQVTRDLTITYVTNVSSAQEQIIQFEYNITRDISIIALRDQNATFGFDIKFKKRFD